MRLRVHLKEDEARDHLVPLSRQAIETIEAMRILSGRGPYVAPNGRSAHKPMSENVMGYLLNRAGYDHRHVPHGWRSTFSTVMNERFPADRAIIDLEQFQPFSIQAGIHR
ncbi:tyrosine-type recombinase/integrase [uncultured Enterovirga sp.]|uniref:tyrosine-type recombinase/integrase n=1 Tax=uncultured Enterovirga sp. TaxID=2026352 RepID=UPI0035CA87ED